MRYQIRVHSCRFVVTMPFTPKNKSARVMALSLQLGLIFLASEILLNLTRRGAAEWTNIRNRWRGAVRRRITAALVGHYQPRPFFHCECDN